MQGLDLSIFTEMGIPSSLPWFRDEKKYDQLLAM
jgi:hypothetical protein